MPNATPTAEQIERLVLEQRELRARLARAERRLLALSVVLVGGLAVALTLPLVSPATAQGRGLVAFEFADRMAALEARTARLEAKTASMSVLPASDPRNPADAPTVRFDGVNLQVVNGRGNATTDVGNAGANGAGNLIVGYNARYRKDGGVIYKGGLNERTGSHNLVVGDYNRYNACGGVVFGRANDVLADYATVTGGNQNVAKGECSTVSGGLKRTAEEGGNWRAGRLFQDD
jgi:hypothetical protein